MTGPGVAVAVVLGTVAAGLAVTAVAQARPMRRWRFLLDTLAIVPEWRFFAQASLHGAIDFARDTHLVVRDRDANGDVGRWQPALSYAVRRWYHAIWNPGRRIDATILTFGEGVADAHAAGRIPAIQQTQRYIVLLRRALDAPRRADAVDRQFAVVHTVGRGERTMGIDFVSAWHRW